VLPIGRVVAKSWPRAERHVDQATSSGAQHDR
jgi:hypothetical protein